MFQKKIYGVFVRVVTPKLQPLFVTKFDFKQHAFNVIWKTIVFLDAMSSLIYISMYDQGDTVLNNLL